MATPPASAALAISEIAILRRNATDMKYVASVEPDRARTTLITVAGTSAAGTSAAQKLGQKIYSITLPSMEKRSLVLSV